MSLRPHHCKGPAQQYDVMRVAFGFISRLCAFHPSLTSVKRSSVTVGLSICALGGRVVVARNGKEHVGKAPQTTGQ